MRNYMTGHQPFRRFMLAKYESANIRTNDLLNGIYVDL